MADETKDSSPSLRARRGASGLGATMESPLPRSPTMVALSAAPLTGAGAGSPSASVPRSRSQVAVANALAIAASSTAVPPDGTLGALSVSPRTASLRSFAAVAGAGAGATSSTLPRNLFGGPAPASNAGLMPSEGAGFSGFHSTATPKRRSSLSTGGSSVPCTQRARKREGSQPPISRISGAIRLTALDFPRAVARSSSCATRSM
jgi:hypothetical protein